MDFDPRSFDDSRDVYGRELNQGSRGGLSNPRERERLDPRDVFTRDLELPRGHARERVWARDSDVTLRASEVRTLATVGAFRAIPASDLRDAFERSTVSSSSRDLHEIRDTLDAEVMTPHYRGAHAAAKVAEGRPAFSRSCCDDLR